MARRLPKVRLPFIRRSLSCLLLATWVASASPGVATPPGNTPEEGLASLELHPDIAVSLFAAEPLVVDPVAVCFTANGDCYVVEMRDYPYGFGPDRAPGGVVRRLRDTDRDGRADESTIFAEGLSYPTSVTPWRDGVLVLAAPQVLFLRDKDGDGKAEESQVVLEGFDLGVTDSLANSLRWGLDGWIHGANGGNGGSLRFAGESSGTVHLGSADFAFHPESRTIRRTFATGGGFGLVDDGLGHTFTTYNIDYLQQRVIPIQQVEAARDLEPFSPTENISDQGASARIYPIVTAATRVNHPEQAGHFSSAGGMGFLDGPPFSDRLANSVFVCDVVCNLVHRDLLRTNGAVFTATRAPEEQDREFIASHDPAFRPVGLESGPDGALYLIDMQRDVIEHPDYIPQGVLANLNVRAGEDRGRIYRVAPRKGLAAGFPALDKMSSAELVQQLASDYRWRQETAHRLLVERGVTDQVDALRVLSRGGTSRARVRAQWLLWNAGLWTEEDSQQALRSTDAAERENLVWMWRHAPHAAGAPSVDSMATLMNNPEPRVRFAAALALDGKQAPSKRESLARMLASDFRDKWSRRAVLLAADRDAAGLLAWAWSAAELQQPVDTAARQDTLQALAYAAASSGEAEPQELLRNWLGSTEWTANRSADIAAVVRGLTESWQRHSASQLSADAMQPIVAAWDRVASESLAIALLDLTRVLQVAPPEGLRGRLEGARALLAEEAEGDAPTSDVTMEKKLASIELLARVPAPETQELLLKLLQRPEPLEVQRAAVQALRRLRDPEVGQHLVAAWHNLSPRLRPDVIQLLLGNRRYHDAILTAMESNAIRFSELNLDLEQRRTLLRDDDATIAARAAKLFGDEEYSNRKAIVGDWLQRLPADGDPRAGQQVFTSKCATCHQVRGLGHQVGPDLQALSHRSVEDLLSHILDPNMAINPNYVSCVVETEDGELINGLLASEAPDSVTLLQPEAKSVTVPRARISQMRTLETSLMPEGLEKDLSPEQLRSLIAFLQARDLPQ
jgi:putative membrane-bound dehydrogenase-like protein